MPIFKSFINKIKSGMLTIIIIIFFKDFHLLGGSFSNIFILYILLKKQILLVKI